MTQAEFTKKSRMVYGERFNLAVRDSKPTRQRAQIGDNDLKKLQQVLKMLESFLEQKNANRKRKQSPAGQRKFDKACAASREAYSSRNPHKPDNTISIPVENGLEVRHSARKMRDSAMKATYEQICIESQAAYNARNPHKGRG